MRLTKDVLGGLMFTGIGGVALAISWGYEAGTALRMGPGYFPRIVAGLMLVLGLLHLFRGLRDQAGEVFSGFAWRPVLIVTASIAGFALLIQPFGTVVAVACLVIGSYFADPARRLRTLPIILAVGILVPILIFNVGLNMPLKIWGF